MNDQKNNKRSKGGRKPKINPCNHRYVFRLDDEDNSKFLSLFEASGIDNKAKFITSVLFSKEIKTVKIDKGTVDFYMRLSTVPIFILCLYVLMKMAGKYQIDLRKGGR